MLYFETSNKHRLSNTYLHKPLTNGTGIVFDGVSGVLSADSLYLYSHARNLLLNHFDYKFTLTSHASTIR